MSELNDCLFCKIISGEIPCDKVHETDHALVFKDISPQAPTHLLVIPKTHVASIQETEDEAVYGHVFATIRDITKMLGLEHFRVAVNNGIGAGQTVFHLHAHVLAGRSLQWPPG